MLWEKVAENWERMSVVARERWNRLADRDLELIDGDREELIHVLAWRYKWPYERAEREVRAWLESDQHAPSLTRPNRVEAA